MVRTRAAVLGSPIAHSLSPVLHAAAYAALGLDWDYLAVECDEAALPSMLDTVRHDPRWVGLSLTMPLKIAAIPLLDSLDPVAVSLGAVNTVLARAGRLEGANTDVEGIVAALVEIGRLPRAPAVLGAGGSARAALGALARIGVPSVLLLARHPAAAAPLVQLGERLGLAVAVRPWELPDDADVVVATTPAGATDDLAALPWPPDRRLVELIYEPWPTRLAARALSAGARVVGGLAVLAGQAAGQVRLLTGREVDVGLLRGAGEAALAARARRP